TLCAGQGDRRPARLHYADDAQLLRILQPRAGHLHRHALHVPRPGRRRGPAHAAARLGGERRARCGDRGRHRAQAQGARLHHRPPPQAPRPVPSYERHRRLATSASSVSSANSRGILALVAGMAAFSVNDVMVKYVTLRFPIGEVMFIRGIMTVALMAAAVIALGYVRQLRFALTGRIILRSIFEATAVVCFIVALVHMKLGDLSAVFLVAPLLLTALSVWFYQEVVGWRRWVAIGVGFA